MSARARRPPPSLVALVGVAAVLRLATLGLQSVWLDEATTAQLERMSFGGMLGALAHSESTPPLFYVLEWPVVRLFGDGAAGLRALSALFGTLTVPVMYALARRAAGVGAGLVAAALTAFAPLLVWYSQEARSYALLVLLSALTLLALPAARERGGRAALVWGVVAAAALATHYFALFVIVPQACILAWRARRGALPGLLLAGAAALALLPLALHQRGHAGAGFIAAIALDTRLAQIPKQLAIGYNAPGDTALAILALLATLAAFALGAARLAPAVRRVAMVWLAVAAAGVALPLALAPFSGLDYLLTRNVLAAWVPAALVVAVVIAAAGRLAAPLTALLCALGLAVTVSTAADVHYQRDNWRDIARRLPSGRALALAVVPASGRVALSYYVPGLQQAPPVAAPARAIELILFGRRRPGEATHAPPLPRAPFLPPGFDPPAGHRAATYTTVVWRSRSTSVFAPELQALAPAPAALLLLRR